MAQSIAAADARRKIQGGDAFLVCAYDDVNKCRKPGVEEAGPLGDFKAQVNSMRDREVLFICA